MERNVKDKRYPRSKVAAILFRERLFREGKLFDYWDAMKAAKPSSMGCGGAWALEVKRRFGWVGTVDEYERHNTFVNTLDIVNRRKLALSESMKSRGRTTIAKALAELPATAGEQEVAWARSHAKLTEALDSCLARDTQYAPPKLKPADVAGCPSRGAWNLLLFALDDPRAFGKQLLQKQRDAVSKAGGNEGSEAEGAVTDDLGEIERLLKDAAR